MESQKKQRRSSTLLYYKKEVATPSVIQPITLSLKYEDKGRSGADKESMQAKLYIQQGVNGDKEKLMVFSSEDLLKLRSVIEVLQDENQSRLITFHGGIVEIVVIPPSQCRNRVVARRFDQIITLEMGNSGYAKPLKTIIFDIPVARSIILELDEIISVTKRLLFKLSTDYLGLGSRLSQLWKYPDSHAVGNGSADALTVGSGRREQEAKTSNSSTSEDKTITESELCSGVAMTVGLGRRVQEVNPSNTSTSEDKTITESELCLDFL